LIFGHRTQGLLRFAPVRLEYVVLAVLEVRCVESQLGHRLYFSKEF
jgi:hypothetical protein